MNDLEDADEEHEAELLRQLKNRYAQITAEILEGNIREGTGSDERGLRFSVCACNPALPNTTLNLSDVLLVDSLLMSIPRWRRMVW